MSASRKSVAARKVINQAIQAMQALGIPLNSDTDRGREMAAMCFLAVLGVAHSADWPSLAKDPRPGLGTRQIIDFINEHFGEKISKGSYDDIRRKHLKKVTQAGLVITTASKPNPSRNDPTRGYALNPDYAGILSSFGQAGWDEEAAKFMKDRRSLADSYATRRAVAMEKLVLPDGNTVELEAGPHNALQRAILDQFRPRFAPGTQLLYLGDADKRMLIHDEASLRALSIPLDSAGILPDIVLWDPGRSWIFFIEAVHSFGPISKVRLHELYALCDTSHAAPVFVTAFLDRSDFRKFSAEIAWETEVWIADEPDHMVHFNGDRFFGPRAPQKPGHG